METELSRFTIYMSRGSRGQRSLCEAACSALGSSEGCSVMRSARMEVHFSSKGVWEDTELLVLEIHNTRKITKT